MITTSLEPTVSRVPALGTAAVHLTLISMLAVINVAAQVFEQSVLQVSAPLAGGVPGPAPEGPVSPTLQETEARGSERNLAVVLARDQVVLAVSSLYLGASPAESRIDADRATAALWGMVQQQAGVLSFLDSFHLLGLIFLIITLLAYLMRRPRGATRTVGTVAE
jgi:hypothetical protein